MNTVSGLFDLYSNAQWVLEILDIYGVDSTRISVISMGRKNSSPFKWDAADLMILGFNQEEAEFYAEGVRRGNILISVATGSEEEPRIRAILRGAGSLEVKPSPKVWPSEKPQTSINANA